MKRIPLVVLLVAMSMLFVSTAMARGMGIERGIKALDLTADQQQRVEKLKISLLEKSAPAKAQLAIKRAELHLLWTAPEPDKKTILGKQSEMDALRQKIREARIDFHLDVLKMLKPEQRAKLLMHGEQGMMGRGKGMGCACGCGSMGEHGHGQGPGMGGQGHPGCGCMGE